MATALEAYNVDNNSYPRDSDSSLDQAELGTAAVDPTSPVFGKAANGAIQLTTPIAYISGILSDPFGVGGSVQVSGGTAIGYRIGSGSWSYSDPPPVTQDTQDSHLIFKEQGQKPGFVIIGVGPDQARCRMGYKAFPFEPINNPKEGPPSTAVNSKGQPFNYTDYDPTNGTTSVGDIYRFGGSGYADGRIMLNGQPVGNANPTGGSAF
jgi:hypothetical protein